MNAVSSLALANQVSGQTHVSELAKPNSLIYNLNRLTWRVFLFSQPYFTEVVGDPHFRVDSSGKIYLKQKLDFEVTPSYSLKIQAEGTRFRLPHFESIENPFEVVGLPERVAAAFRWIERKEHTIVNIDFDILVTDEPIFVPFQEIALELTWEDFVKAKVQNKSIDIATPVKTRGDEAKRFKVSQADEDIFAISPQGLLTFYPAKVLDEEFHPVAANKIKWEHVLQLEVSDAADGSNWVNGQVHIHLTVSDLPLTAAGDVSFDTLVNAAKQAAPPKDLAKLLEIEVPETSERSLKIISDKIS